MIDNGLFSFHHAVACIVLLAISSNFINSVLNLPTVQNLTQEVYGSLGIGDNITDNITKELSTQAPGTQNITTGGGGDNQIQQRIENMTEGPANKINSTNLAATSPEALQSKQVENGATNGTVIVIPPQPVQSKPTVNESSIIGPPRMMQSNPRGIFESGDMQANISALKPITKEQAAKAEQEANAMINAHYEKLEQEKQKEKEQAAALAAAAQVNQTINNASQAEGSLEDNATASAIETEDDTDVEAERVDEPEEDEENDNENGGNEEEEEDSE